MWVKIIKCSFSNFIWNNLIYNLISRAEQSQMASQKIKLECPFDLETVFTLQYSTEGLKGVLEWIIENLGNLNTTVGDLDKKLAAKIAQIDK